MAANESKTFVYRFMIHSLFIKFQVYSRLGFFNILRNVAYKIKFKLNYFRKVCPESEFNEEHFFPKDRVFYKNKEFLSSNVNKLFFLELDNILNGRIRLFFDEVYKVSSPPQWFFHGYEKHQEHWSKARLNENIGEDVKLTWDLSRFHWLQVLACGYKINQDYNILRVINLWVGDWAKKNKINIGVNWACGQESAIRVIHTLNAIELINLVSIPDNIVLFVREHSKRVKLTISYAISQDNNHGTSEAAALFICGAWLLKNENDNKYLKHARCCLKVGRRLLEERIKKLIMDDGGFSMYSTNYHRVVLNTVAIVEFWRRKLDQPIFSDAYYERCSRAIQWLYRLVDKETGDTLNLGTNDGSNPFIIQSSDYRDYRPSIQFASVMLLGRRAYPESTAIDEPLFWLGESNEVSFEAPCKLHSQILADSGIVIINKDDELSDKGRMYIKYPCYQFRPSQVDLLHVDFWWKGDNILRDAGSYSYNTSPSLSEYFPSIKAHNTIQIDNLEPMPRISPFLLGRWSIMESLGHIKCNDSEVSWSGGYKITSSAKHYRHIHYKGNVWSIADEVSGAEKSIILRWRLKDYSWLLEGNVLLTENLAIEVQCDENFEIRLTEGKESRYYNRYVCVPILEVLVKESSARLITNIYLGRKK